MTYYFMVVCNKQEALESVVEGENCVFDTNYVGICGGQYVYEMSISGDLTPEEASSEAYGQFTDGIFENCKPLNIYLIGEYGLTEVTR